MIRWIMIASLCLISLEANNFREGMLAYKNGNYDKAVGFFKDAVRIDQSVNAHYILGRMYLEGEGVKKDLGLAIKLLEFAEENGNVPSGCYLSEAYMESKTKRSYIAWGLTVGLRKNISHCKKVFQQYLTYK